MARFKPKAWLRPRSRRWRGAHGPSYSPFDIIKDIWSDGWERPAWAKLAHERGWITAGEYYAVKPEDTGERPITGWLYEESPMFGILKKDVSFS